MHAPRPYGLAGEPRSEADIAAVEALARRLTNFKTTGNLSSYKLVVGLPSGGSAIALDMGGVFKIIVRYPDEENLADVTFDGLAEASIPMLFSGVITKAIYMSGQGVGMELSQTAQRRLANYKPKPVIGARQSLLRFEIEYASRHSEFVPKNSGSRTHSQYVKLRPTWFSGSMATLVQVAGGYGRQDFKQLPDTPVERATMLLPEKVRARIAEQIGNMRLPGYTGTPPESGQIQFDYKFMETHAVSFDNEHKPWIVRVNSSGVYAMPMPLVPATTMPAFRQYIDEVGDDEILWLLDKFGGMPSGEGFPVGADAFEAWRRAGVVSKVCDVADFYQNSMFSSAIGWSSNSMGTRLVNTCWEFGSDGIQVAKMYSIALALGAAKNGGRLTQGFEVSGESDAQQINAYLAALFKGLPSGVRGLAIRYKIRRSSASSILSRARASNGTGKMQAEVDYWDNLQMQPIGSHSGSTNMTALGRIWAPGRPKFHPQIKFPEPFMSGCVSHDFGRLEGHPVPNPAPRCDTIMFGYFVDDELKVVKYFRDERQYASQGDNNYEECMTVGSWQQTVTAGDSQLLGHFYTTDFDERKAAAPVTTVTNIVGTDLGYDDPPMFGFDHFFSQVGTLWRNRWFQHKNNKSSTKNYTMSVALCVPFLERNAVLHAFTESTGGESVTDSLEVFAIRDPNSYRYFTYDFVMAWVGGSTKGNMAHVTNVSPYPKDGNPVWVTGYNYDPYPCSDFADNGDWMGGLPQNYTWLIHPNKNEWRDSGGGSRPKVKEYTLTTTKPNKTTEKLEVSTLPQVGRVTDNPRLAYFQYSPDDSGGVFYADAIKLVAGDAVYASVSEPDPEAPTQRKRWGFSKLADHKSAHHFIGVINA